MNRRWYDGIWTWVALCGLVAGSYAAPDRLLKWACLAGLGLVWLLTPVPKAASARRREDTFPTRERGD